MGTNGSNEMRYRGLSVKLSSTLSEGGRVSKLENTIVAGMTRIICKRRKHFGDAVVLKGMEGELLMDLLVILADDRNHIGWPDPWLPNVFFHRSPILCERDCTTELNKWRMVG
jgi:hypothetical protein